ncbi:MAG: trans-sulfuration enzyme family protein [Anaerolineaceae bacterium]
MKKAKYGISTLVNHFRQSPQTPNPHISPIYQTSAFRFEDVESGSAAFQGEKKNFIYTRMDNPNHLQVVDKIAALECIDLQEQADGYLFSSGMAAITSAISAVVKSGETLIAQQNIYGSTNSLLKQLQEQNKLNIIWLPTGSPDEWEQAFAKFPNAKLAYAETPSNPNLSVIDLESVAEIAHKYQSWLLVDNTFASPYCQRPFNQGADIIIHSTTKYLSGHGVIIGGIALSRHKEWVKNSLYSFVKLFGATPSPFDAWLTEIGLKTFELRMQRHCENAMKIATWLQNQPIVSSVFYPGLSSHPQFNVAQKQMLAFGGMLAFELSGGLPAGIQFMNHLELMSIVPTLGNVDTLVQHPASMSHVSVPREERIKVGVSDGLIRVSVGIENVEDLIADLDQALSFAN